jgi:aspartate kinase
MKVLKFGGSTIKTPERIGEVVNIIKNDEDKLVLVLSALHGQTNEIRKYLTKIRTEKKELEEFIKKIRKRHFDMANKVIPDKEILQDVLEILDKLIVKLERLIFGVAYTEELTPRTTDLILSSAERMSVHIMAGVLKCNGIKACAYEADKIGIATDGVFCNASADLKTTERNLRKSILPEVNNGELPVITGFFGCDGDGRTCTFGKNGSDYSAAVIANALNASVLELWKDVNGFLSADPNIVDSAYTINKLSYDEAAELAHFGIELLHPRTVEPVRLKLIPIEIKNINYPKNIGTRIFQKGFKTENIIKSVVYSTNLAEVNISAVGAGHRPGVMEAVAGVLNKSNINIYSINTSQTQLSILIYKADLQRCLNVLENKIDGSIKRPSYQNDIALVCVVGEGAAKSLGLAAKIFSAVSDADVNINLISAGASNVALHFVVQKNDLTRAIIAIHDTFCK